MSAKNYFYTFNCTNSDYDTITNIIDSAKEIKYRTFFKHVDLNHLLEIFPTYFKNKRQGLTLKNDWHVTYHKSKHKGNTIYYMQHSAIEYIFEKN